jgi:hypothetical protein
VKNDTIFLGGSFTQLGFQNSYIANLTSTNDVPAYNFPITNGTVRCVISMAAADGMLEEAFPLSEVSPEQILPALNLTKR